MANEERSTRARAAPLAGIVVLAASFVVATNLLGARDTLFGTATPAPRASASSRSAGGSAFTPISTSPSSGPTSRLRSEPWWQQVGRFHGAGASAPDLFRISSDAIQWRVTWTCERGRFVIRAAGEPGALVDASCGGPGRRELTKRPAGALAVHGDGSWTARIEQQVDVPLVETPLAAMRAAGTSTVATGSLYRIDQVGRGRMTLYRLADGRRALRLESFYVTANIDLQLRLSPLRRPRSTRQYLSAPSRYVGPLDVTTGSLNFILPRGVDPRRYRSVVVWCPIVDSAYAAATLRFAGSAP
jgi:hypothetical protein